MTIVNEPRQPYPISMSLSGGGFRASLFHLGALKRLNEFGILSRIKCMSSVSGGSITNGVLATRWDNLVLDRPGGVFKNFDSLVMDPIIAFCKEDLRTSLIIWQRANPLNWGKLIRKDYSVTDLLAKSYERHLDLDRPLASVSKKCDFVFCATNLETGANWEFERTQMGDYRTGKTAATCSVGQAVAASSSFPVVFPPLVLKFSGRQDFQYSSKTLPDESFHAIPLTDGGVYDNLGLEPIWKQSQIVLTSDAGQPFVFQDDPQVDVLGRMSRCFDIMMNQSPILRKRWLISLFECKKLSGTYWGITTTSSKYQLPAAIGYPESLVNLISSIRTDLDPFSDGEIACLINHGYSLADCGIKKHVGSLLPTPEPPFVWPFPHFIDHDVVVGCLKNSSDRGILQDIWNSIADSIG